MRDNLQKIRHNYELHILVYKQLTLLTRINL